MHVILNVLNNVELIKSVPLKIIRNWAWFDIGVMLNVSNSLQEVYC